MSKHQKALSRLLAKPADFQWSELATLMEGLGYELRATAGSSRKFVHPASNATLFIHEPHPSKTLKAYQVRDTIHFLKQENQIP